MTFMDGFTRRKVNYLWVSYPVVLNPSKLQHFGMAKPSPKHAGEPALVALGQAIRSIRTELRMSQESLANSASLDRSYVGGIERGEHNLTVINLIKIADQLHMKPSDILLRSKL